MSITKREMSKLGQGDIVWWQRGSRTGFFRTIYLGPRDLWGSLVDENLTRLHIDFPIYRRSWTGRPHTGYNHSDIYQFVTVTGKKNQLLFTPDELDRLIKSQFQISKALMREVKEFEKAARRGHWYQVQVMRNNPNFCHRILESLKALRFADL